MMLENDPVKDEAVATLKIYFAAATPFFSPRSALKSASSRAETAILPAAHDAHDPFDADTMLGTRQLWHASAPFGEGANHSDGQLLQTSWLSADWYFPVGHASQEVFALFG